MLTASYTISISHYVEFDRLRFEVVIPQLRFYAVFKAFFEANFPGFDATLPFKM